MKGCLVMLTVLAASAAAKVIAGKEFCNDYTYVEDVNGWYKLHLIPATWSEAALRCRYEGGMLASPVDQHHTQEMVATMKKAGITMPMFTGFRSTTPAAGVATSLTQDYVTDEGVQLSKVEHKWADGEPDNYENNEGCIAMLADGTLADIPCENTHPYMCYWRHDPLTSTSNCNNVDPAYEYSYMTDSCYKFHNNPLTWSKAFLACEAEGGHLVIIDNKAEAEIVSKLFEKNPPEGFKSVPGFDIERNIALIGFHNWGNLGDYRTIHGVPLADTYSDFRYGEPNHPSKEFCGSVFRSGVFNDFPCHRPAVFICEKPPLARRIMDTTTDSVSSTTLSESDELYRDYE